MEKKSPIGYNGFIRMFPKRWGSLLYAIFILSLLVALLSFSTDFQNKSLRYFGAMWLLIGLGCVKPIMEEEFFPKFGTLLLVMHWKPVLTLAGILCSMVALHLAPVIYLMFGMTCYKLLEKVNGLINKKTLIPLLLVLPVLSFLLILPRIRSANSNNLIYLILSSWSVPYGAVGIWLLLHSCRKSASKRAKEQSLLLCYLAVPAGIASLTTCYVLRAFGMHQAWVINRWIVLATFTFYLYIISRYGLLGIKLRIEKNRLDHTINAVSSGASIFNHTIKNEVLKISFSANNLKELKDRTSETFDDNLQVILNSTRYLEAMAHRIKDTMQNIELKEQDCDLSRIVERAIELVYPYLIQKQVRITKEYLPQIMLRCDELHLTEVLINLLQNAIEAISLVGTGEIRIRIEKNQNNTLLSIKDNGEGIPPEVLPYIMEPFFSTKERRKNYGLGLSYCYRVIQKHGGTIEFDSVPSVGTSVWLTLPARHR